MSNALALVVHQVEIGCDGKIITLQLICADDYGAQIVFDDIRSRLTSREGLGLTLRCAELNEGGPTP